MRELVIVGTRFRGGRAVALMTQMTAGDPVTLRREPDNKYDRNAVACYCGDTHIGYLPAALNGEIAHALDLGVAVTATVSVPGSVKQGFVVEPKVTIRGME